MKNFRGRLVFHDVDDFEPKEPDNEKNVVIKEPPKYIKIIRNLW